MSTRKMFSVIQSRSRTLFSRLLAHFVTKRQQAMRFPSHKGTRIGSTALVMRFYASSANNLPSDWRSSESPSDDRGPEKSVGGYNLEELLDRIAKAQLQKDEHLLVKSKNKRPKVRRTTPMTIDELVHFLKDQNARDICVLKIPPEREYVDYFVVCSGLGTRHIRMMADSLAAEVSEKECG